MLPGSTPQTPAIPPQAAPASRPRREWAFGPGLVFLLAVIGPQDLVTNSAAGANFGYKLLWTLAIIVLARYSILEASARYVLVTGETLMAGYARAGRWLIWLLFIAIIIKRHIAGLYQLLLLGSSINLIVPLPIHGSATLWALLSWAFGFAIIYWGKYRLLEWISKPMAVALGGSLMVAAIASRPDVGQVFRGALIPSLPEGHGVYSYATILLALIGTGAGTLSNLKYATFVHEKGWRGPSFLNRQRVDLVLSGLALYVMLVLVQVAAAATLGASGAKLKDVDDLLPMFTSVLGAAGQAILGVGIWTAVFTTFTGANNGYSLMLSDMWHNILRKPAGSASTSTSPGELPAYRWSIIFFCVSPLYVLFTAWQPMLLVMTAAGLLGALLPLIVVILLWLTNNRRLMGAKTNGLVSNTILVLVTIAALYLTWQSAWEAWAKRAAW